MPTVTTTVGEMTVVSPKYIRGFYYQQGDIACPYKIFENGTGTCFIAANVQTLADHQFLFDQIDTLSVDPRSGANRDLDVNITTGEISALTDYLDRDGRIMPMQWATISDTRRHVLRGVFALFRLFGSLTAFSGTPVTQWGLALNTPWSDVPQQQQEWIFSAATAIGLPALVQPQSQHTLRVIFRYLAEKFGDRPYSFGQCGGL